MKFKFAVLVLLILLSSTFGTVSAQNDRSVDNLVAFTKLAGLVRYFHPSDQVANADWEAFTAAHVEAVMNAEDDEALITLLNTLFTPYAPTVQVYPQGNTPELAEALSDSEDVDSVVQWLHVPVADMSQRTGGIMPPERVYVDMDNDIFPAEFSHTVTGWTDEPITLPVHHPVRPYVTALTETIEARVPLALYTSGGVTLPVVESVPELPFTSISGNTLEGRLTAVIYTWNYFQHFFSYWDVLEDTLGVDWEAALREAITGAMADEDAADFWFTLRRLTAYLNDGHIGMQPSRQALGTLIEEHGYGFGSTLPFMWDMVEGELTVTNLIAEDTQGVQLGDVITAIDGQAVPDVLAEWEALTSRHGDFGRFDILVNLLAGEDGTTTTLTVEPVNGDDAYTAEITHTVPFPGDLIYQREARPETSIAQLGSGILYVDLTRVSEEEYAAALDQLAQAEGLVFDMRGYPNAVAINVLGHLRGEDLTSAPFLVPITVMPDHRDMRFVDVTSSSWIVGRTPVFTENVAFIVNSNGAVSYAESIMGIVEGYALGEIVGTPTVGANGNVATVQIPGGYATGFTSLHVTKFDGSPLFTVGVIPTLPVERTRAGVAEGRDELLEAAFETVGGTTLDISPVVLNTAFLDAFQTEVRELLSVQWSEIEPGAYQNSQSESLLYASVELDTMEATVAMMRDGLGNIMLEETDQTESGWTIYQSSEPVNGYVTAYALREINGSVFGVALYANEAAFEMEYAQEFLPLLTALTFGE